MNTEPKKRVRKLHLWEWLALAAVLGLAVALIAPQQLPVLAYKVLMLSENQSTYIPLGQVHRLANPGKVPLEIIEVQSGSYLGEDDIVRYEDTYGRN